MSNASILLAVGWASCPPVTSKVEIGCFAVDRFSAVVRFLFILIRGSVFFKKFFTTEKEEQAGTRGKWKVESEKWKIVSEDGDGERQSRHRHLCDSNGNWFIRQSASGNSLRQVQWEFRATSRWLRFTGGRVLI